MIGFIKVMPFLGVSARRHLGIVYFVSLDSAVLGVISF